ncbi:MAG: MFS transporter [Ktedonobacteraceae bacterium]|nr:MFS transporter [Ktedonobacteraceae bacterium]
MNKLDEIQKEPLQARQSRKLPIGAFFIGSAISYIGDMFTLLAIPWFVLQTTGSVIQTGITAFFSTLPMVFSAFFGSALVDRLGYKRTSVLGDIASSIAVALIPLLYLSVGIAFWQLLALVFLGGLLKSPGGTARRSMLPDLAHLVGMRLERANAFSDGINRVAGLIAAPLAGVLIALIGTSNLLWIDAISFALSALLLGVALPKISSSETQKGESKRGYFAELWEGVQFIHRDALVLSLVFVIMITNLLDGAFFSVVEPSYIKHVFNSAVPYGLIVAASGGSAFVGTLVFSLVGHRLPRRFTYAIGYIVGGALTFWVFLFFPVLPVLIAWQIIAGFAIASVNPIFLR